MKFLTILLIAVCAKSLSAQTTRCIFEGIQIRHIPESSVFGCKLRIQNKNYQDNYRRADIVDKNSAIQTVLAIGFEVGSTSTLVPSILSTTFTEVYAIDFSSGGLSLIRPSDFNGFSKLKYLYLNNNRISGILPTAFNGNPSLQYIDLSNNLLGSISPDQFPVQTELYYLRLNNNYFQSLPSELFSNLQSLRYLEVRNCDNFKSIGNNIFNNLNELGTIIIEGNLQLAELPANVFNGVTTIDDLNLSNNAFTFLPDGLFNGKTITKLLNLSKNKLTTISNGPFDGLTNQHISFEDNPIETIESAFIVSSVAQHREITLSGPCYNGSFTPYSEHFIRELMPSCIV